MRRLATAALLAAPLLLASLNTASANNGPCTFGLGCGGHCLRFFPFLHQHGPLFNYGPYYGYPPFEPYGYWNAYLHYTGPVDGHGGGSGAYGWIHGGYPHVWGGGNPHPLHGNGLFHGGLFHGGSGHGGGIFRHGGGCGSGGCGHGGLFHRHRGGCDSCGTVAAAQVTSGNVFDRYTGFGQPDSTAAFHAQTPSFLTPGVVPVGYTGR